MKILGKPVTIEAECACGFKIARTVELNKYGYFELSQSYCPNDFNMLLWNIKESEDE